MADEPQHEPQAAHEAAGGHGAPPEKGGAGKAHGKLAAALDGPHREEIIVISSVAGVLLAYFTFKKTTTSSTPKATTSTSTLAPTSQALGTTSGLLAGGGAQDPNAGAGLQSYLQNLSQSLQAMQTAQNSTALTPVTPSALPIAFDMAGAASDTYIRNSVSGEIDQVQPNGTNYWLTPANWAAARGAGASAPTEYAGGSAITGARAPVIAYGAGGTSKASPVIGVGGTRVG